MSNRKKAKNTIIDPMSFATENTRNDGRKYNGYVCSTCTMGFLTVDLDEGVTPMFMPCLRTYGCDGIASSMGYPRTPPPKGLPLMVEWYEPELNEMLMEVLPAEALQHVAQGGLLRRAPQDAPDWVKAKIGLVVQRKGETDGNGIRSGDGVLHGIHPTLEEVDEQLEAADPEEG